MDFIRQMGEQLSIAESIFAFFIFALAVLLAYLFLQYFTKRKIKDAQSSLEQEQIKVSTLKADNEKLENDIKVNLAEVNESRLREEDSKAKNAALVQEKDQLESQIIMLSESEAVLKDQLDDVNSRYSIMETSYRNLNDNLKRVSVEFETSVAQKDNLHSRIQELEATNQELLDARTRENGAFTTQMNSLKESLSDLQIQYGAAKNELSNQTEVYNQFKSEVLAMKAEANALKEENEQLKDQLEHQAASKSKMQHTLKSLLVKQNQTFFKIEAMEDELEALRKIKSAGVTKEKEAELNAVFNAQIDALKETLEDATNKVATLEAEKINYSQEIEILRGELEEAKAAEAQVKTDDNTNPSFSSSSVSLNDDSVLSEELVALKSQLQTANEAKVARQQEADRLRASVITLQADLAKAEEDKEQEQEHFLKELAELKASHQQILELETIKLDSLQAKIAELESSTNSEANMKAAANEELANATAKIATLEAELDGLEAKITLLEASANDAENDVIAMEASKNDVLEIEHEKLASARDENMKLQTQVNDLLSKVRELQTVSYEKEDGEKKNQMIDSLAAQATQLEAMANDAVNDAIELEAKFTQILEQESEKLAAAKDETMSLEAKMEELEAKITLLEASANDAENDAIEMENSKSNLLELEHEKLAFARDENMKLQSQVNSLLSKVRELQTVSEGMTDEESAMMESLEEQATLLEAMANEATNETIEVQTKYNQILEQEAEKVAVAKDKAMSLEAQIEELEAKITVLEASANDAENDAIEMENSKSNLLELEHEKLASARDENMKLQTQVNSLLSKVRELQTLSEGGMTDEESAMMDSLEEQATLLEAMANDATNDVIEVETKYQQILEQEAEKLAASKDREMSLEAKVEVLEAKITLLEASANEAENEVIAMESSKSSLLDMEHEKLASARDENMKLQTQVNSLLSKVRELQLHTDDGSNDELIDNLEAQATLLEAMANDATNETIEVETKYNQILEQESEKLSTAQDKIISLELMVETLEANVTRLEAASNDAVVDSIELENKYQQILDLENEKLAAAKENSLNLEIQVDLLQAKLARMEAMANDAENDLIAYQAKMEKMLELENSKLSAVQEANLALQSQINIFKGNVDNSVNVDIDNKNTTNIVNNTSIIVESSERADSKDQNLDAFQAEIKLKKLFSVKYAGISRNNENDLKIIKGIGPRIEEKLHAIGIFTFKQIAELDEDGIKLLTTALDIFPGRIERDQWVEQAKKLAVSNEHLTVEEARAAVEALIGNRIPKATAADKNDLKAIKGVGAFIEKKLNGLGIYAYNQIASFDKDIIEKVTIAIEFFPGRIERDKWVKQAKEMM